MCFRDYLKPIVILGLLLLISPRVWPYQPLILDKAEYAGFYEFGPNNISGHLSLMAADGRFYGQIEYYDRQAKRSVVITLRNVSINKSELSADGLSAAFVLNHLYAKPHQGLLVKKCQLGDLDFRKGVKSSFDLRLKLC